MCMEMSQVTPGNTEALDDRARSGPADKDELDVAFVRQFYPFFLNVVFVALGLALILCCIWMHFTLPTYEPAQPLASLLVLCLFGSILTPSIAVMHQRLLLDAKIPELEHVGILISCAIGMVSSWTALQASGHMPVHVPMMFCLSMLHSMIGYCIYVGYACKPLSLPAKFIHPYNFAETPKQPVNAEHTVSKHE